MRRPAPTLNKSLVGVALALLFVGARAGAQFPNAASRVARPDWMTASVPGPLLTLQQKGTGPRLNVFVLKNTQGAIVWSGSIEGHTLQSGKLQVGSFITSALPAVTALDAGSIAWDSTVAGLVYVDAAGAWRAIGGGGGSLPDPVTVAHGGTSRTTIPAGGVVYGNGASLVGVASIGAAGTVLKSDGSVPLFGAIDLSLVGVSHMGLLPWASLNKASSNITQLGTGGTTVGKVLSAITDGSGGTLVSWESLPTASSGVPVVEDFTSCTGSAHAFDASIVDRTSANACVITLASTPLVGSHVLVQVDRAYWHETDDYTVVGTALTFTTNAKPILGEHVRCIIWN